MKSEDSHPQHKLELNPSAAIPFAHDGPGSHSSKLGDLYNAVVDSGAEYVHGAVPWNEYSDKSIWIHEQPEYEMIKEDYQILTMPPFEYKISPSPVPSFELVNHIYEVPPSPAPRYMHKMGNLAIKSDNAELDNEQDTINAWVNKNIVFAYDKDALQYNWQVAEGGQAFLEAHQQEIMEAIPYQFRHKASHDRMLDVIRMVAPDGTYSNEFAFKMIKENPFFLMDGQELFPDFKFDMDYVRAMMQAGMSRMLMAKWEYIEQDCLQEAVELVSKENQSAVFSVIDQLVGKMHISRELLLAMAEHDPRGLVDMIQFGDFPELKKDPEIIRWFFDVYDPTELADMGMLDELEVSDLSRFLIHGMYKAMMFARLRSIGRMVTPDQFVEVIDAFGAISIVGEVSGLSEEVQSYVFQSLATQPGVDWVGYLGPFNHLSDDDYIFILDSMQLIDEKIQAIDQIVDLFSGASTLLKREYNRQYRQIQERREREKQEHEAMNLRRDRQSQAERTYFEAGSVSVDPHDYHENLDADAIIEALEYNGCVREAGDIQEMVNDTSRDNLMTCVAGSVYALTTYNLGKDAGSDGGHRQIVTEHEVLQDFMDFMQKLPPTPYGQKESLTTELTYIGEREYGEAVEGIALYWKWFLEKDPESQLYIGAIVSSGWTTKSDVYMLDRVLAHFSDDELAKYKGRILTGGDQVTQTDPEKVKAVLIDDWTISGSQLRSAYGNFVREYPHLAKCLEVQLIAASQERVALGIEQVSGAQNKEGVYDRNLPTKVRAYYVAHTAETASMDARSARITGSHSSVDYGFTNDISKLKSDAATMPLITSVVRPYRQEGYTKVNIERLQRINEDITHAA